MHELLNAKGVTRDEIKDYLDDLRLSGATNMFGAASYLASRFDLTDREARAELRRWMEEF